MNLKNKTDEKLWIMLGKISHTMEIKLYRKLSPYLQEIKHNIHQEILRRENEIFPISNKA